MTVKTQGGKVITKSGKVSCGCCEECCMYPAAALVDDLYSYEDLPDAIDVGGIEYSKIDPPESVAGFTRYYINSNSEYLGILEGEGADSLWTYEGGGGPCLINGFNGAGGEREDQFADTYTVTINPPDDNAGTYTVTRRSICVWSTQVQESGEPAGLKLSYIDAVIGGGFAYTWEIELDTSYIKDGFANTPTGDYAGGNATVS